MTRADQRQVLEAFSRDYTRELHNLPSADLGRFPAFVFQQLYNRLQWHVTEGEAAERMTDEAARRCAPGRPPWLHLRTRQRESEALTRTLAGHTASVTACAVSPDGTWIVSASADQTLKIWDVASGRKRVTLSGHTSYVTACAVSPDGTWIVSASADQTLKIWDAASGRERATLADHTDWVLGCAVSPDGTWIVSASDDDVPEDLGEMGPRQHAVDTLKIWDVAGGTLTWPSSLALNAAPNPSHSNRVNACAVSSDGTWIVSAGEDQTLKIWDVASLSERATLIGHTAGVTGCAVSPDGTWIVSASGDHTLRIWDVASAAERATLPGHTARVTGCAVSPDGTWIVSAADDHALKTWETASGAERRTLNSYFECCDCAVSPDGTWIVSGVGLAIAIWDAATGDVRREGYPRGDHHQSGASACAVSPDGTWIVSASADRTLKIWDAAFNADGAKVTFSGHTSYVSACAVSPDGTWIVSASADETLKIWDVASSRERATLAGHTNWVNDCAVSPDGTWIVSASSDQSLRIWDVASGRERATLPGHTAGVTGCAVSPDGTWIVSASLDRTLRIWDAATRAERAVLALPGEATAVACHPSAPIVACGDRGGGVHLAHLHGVVYGPLVVTARGRGQRRRVRCPACGEAFPVKRNRLRTDTTCPGPACGTRLRINPFVLRLH